MKLQLQFETTVFETVNKKVPSDKSFEWRYHCLIFWRPLSPKCGWMDTNQHCSGGGEGEVKTTAFVRRTLKWDLDFCIFTRNANKTETKIITVTSLRQRKYSVSHTDMSQLCKQKLSAEKETPEKEDRYTGTVTWKVYFDYWRAGAGIPFILFLIILTVGTQVNKAIFF